MKLDDINRELAEIQDRLLAAADDGFAEKHRLLVRRDELREMAAGHRIDLDADRSDADLLAELAARRSQLAAVERDRIDMVMQSGGGGSGSGYEGWGGAQLNQQIDQGQGRDEIVARIGRLTSILADRGVRFPDPD